MEGQQLLTDKAKPSVPSHEPLGSVALMSGDTADILSEKQAQPEIRSDEKLQVEFLSQTQVEIPQEVREVMDSLLDKVADGEAQEKNAEVLVANLNPYPPSSSEVYVIRDLDSQVDKAKEVEALDLSTCPILQTALTDTDTVMKTAYKIMPKKIVVLVSTIKHIITQVLLQVDPQAFQGGVYLETPAIINDTQALLWSIPWVEVTEEEELLNGQQSTDAYEVAKTVINNLEQVLGPKPVLARALGIGSHILTRYIVHLVGLCIAKTVPVVYAANEEERRISQDMVNICPLPARLIISGELFSDFIVKFILKLHPMNGRGTKQLDQQALLLLVVKMASVAFNILRKIPGISVDENLCPPLCNMRKTVLHMQSAMIHQFGTTIKIKKLVAMKDTVIISTIPSAICEGILMVYKGISDTYPLQVLGPRCPIARSCEEAMESKLFAVALPEDLRKTIYDHYGSWVGKLALFLKAFPLNDRIKLEYIRRVSLPRSSNRDVVWIDPKYFVGDDDEEVVTSSNTMPDNPLALDVSQAAFLKQFPQTDVFEVTTKDCGKPVQEPARTETERNKPKMTNLDIVPVILVRKVFDSVFADSCTIKQQYGSWEDVSLCNDMVEHLHIQVQKEALKYQNQRLFLHTLRKLNDEPDKMAKFLEDVSFSIKSKYFRTFHDWPMVKAQLYPEIQFLLVCDIMVREIMAHLRPTLTFAKDTKKGDDRPYCINIPVKRETRTPDDTEKTKLELCIEKASADIMKELLTPLEKEPEPFWKTGWMAMMEEENNKKKKEKKGCGWFSGLFGRKRKNSERSVDGGLSQARILEITSTQTKRMDTHTFTQRQI
ncbi:uncharacterized protein LOC118938238 [Oncorhynchus mykiss]|uniref:uncharacterized protein LOC118938238 n=1 Tax=Oncorhynchus mykiss TaxID=8022 RepID=UPI0018786F34|nr:uncharacterized protein LOC118938238 [Oncorhynchus mykiss]